MTSIPDLAPNPIHWFIFTNCLSMTEKNSNKTIFWNFLGSREARDSVNFFNIYVVYFDLKSPHTNFKPPPPIFEIGTTASQIMFISEFCIQQFERHLFL